MTNMTPYEAYLTARNVPGADLAACQTLACQEPKVALWFARNVPDADIAACQAAACRNQLTAYWFAQDVRGADVRYCLTAAFGGEVVGRAFDLLAAVLPHLACYQGVKHFLRHGLDDAGRRWLRASGLDPAPFEAYVPPSV